MSEDNHISAGEHTLAILEKQGYHQSTKEAILYIGKLNAISSSRENFHKLIIELKRAAQEFDNLTIRIHSGGGNMEEFAMMLPAIQSFKHITTVLDVQAYSAAALIFCLGDTRLVTEYSALMFHNYGAMLQGKGQELTARLESTDDRATRMLKDHILKRGFLTEEEFSQMLDNKDFWFNKEQMLERGIATGVATS